MGDEDKGCSKKTRRQFTIIVRGWNKISACPMAVTLEQTAGMTVPRFIIPRRFHRTGFGQIGNNAGRDEGSSGFSATGNRI